MWGHALRRETLSGFSAARTQGLDRSARASGLLPLFRISPALQEGELLGQSRPAPVRGGLALPGLSRQY